MKTTNKTNKQRSRNRALIRTALLGVCIFGLGAATCEAQVQSWSADGPPRRLSKEDEEQAQRQRKAAEDKALREEVTKEFVKNIQKYQAELYRARAEAEARRYEAEQRRQFWDLIGGYIPVSIPGPFSLSDLIRVATSERPFLEAAQIAAHWGISHIPSIPYVPIQPHGVLNVMADNLIEGMVDNQVVFSQIQFSRQNLLNNIAFRGGDQRSLSASNFALGESVNVNEMDVLMQNQADRVDDRLCLAAFYAKGEEDETYGAEKQSFLAGLRNLPEFSDSVGATLAANERLAAEVQQYAYSNVDATSLVSSYLTPSYFASLQKMTELFEPERHEDGDLLEIAKAFDEKTNFNGGTARDQYGRTYRTPGNLYAADVFGYYGIVCMQRGRAASGELGDALLQTGESLLQKSIEIAKTKLTAQSGRLSQWLTYSALRCQFAGLNDHARKLYEESDAAAANVLTQNPTTSRYQQTRQVTQTQDVRSRRAWNAEMASRALLLDNRFEDAQRYLDVLVDLYEGWNDPEYDDFEKARLPRALYAEAKANAGLAKFLTDFDADARFLLEDAKEKFDKCASTPEGRSTFVIEGQITLLCRLAQLASRVEKYDEALEYVDSAIALKRKYLDVRKKDWEGHQRYFESVPAYFEAVYVEKTNEGCDVSGEKHKLDAAELAKRKETWESIVESQLSYEKNLKASILYKRGDPAQGDLTEALKSANEILETLEACGLDKSQAAAETLLTRAQTERRLGSVENLQSAKKDLEQASTILGLAGIDVEEIENNPTHSRAYFEGLYACERAHVERELAVLNEQGAAERAKELYDVAERYFGSAVISNAAYVDLYYGRAMLSRLTGDNAAAYVDLDEAIKCSLEVRKTSAVNDKDRALRLSQFFYLFEAKANWTLADSTDARETAAKTYETMESSRTQSFEDLATLANFDLASFADEKALNELDAKKAQVKDAEIVLTKAETDLQVAGANGESSSTIKELSKIYDESLETYSAARNAYNAEITRLARENVAQAFGSTPGEGGFDEIQNLALESNLVVCEYMLGENNCYLVVFGVGVEPRAYELSVGDNETERLLRGVGVELESGPLTAEKLNVLLTGFLNSVKDSPSEFKTYSNVLWTTLFPAADLRDRICGATADFGLLIVPDGALSQLPFEALVVDDGRSTGDVETYLIDQAPIVSYAPSGWLFCNLTNRLKKDETEKVLTVGNPETELGSLTESETEVRNIVEYCSNNVRFKEPEACRDFIGAEATEKNVRANLDRTINHLAVHGVVDFQRGKWSGALVLTPGPEGDDVSDDDGMLAMSEILRLDMSGCELAALSACDTNRTKRQIDEGVWSIGRGMILAGARRVVASNWAVNDSSTSELISDFFRKVLDEGAQSPDCALALKEAKLAVKEQAGWDSPYFWAPFVLIGAR